MTQEALRLALEALETELSIDWTNNNEFNASAEKMYEAIAVIKHALAQPEPVAWYYPDGLPDQCTTNKAYAEMEPAWTPLYTHSQRTWVGLTDEDCKGMSAGDKVVAMWADRTLKEKNSA